MDKIPLSVYIAVFLFLFVSFFTKVFVAWFISKSQSYPLSLGQLFGMHFRKQNLYKMIKIHNTIKENNLDLTLEQAEIFILNNGIVEDLLQVAKDYKNDSKYFSYDQYVDNYFKEKKKTK